MSRSLSIAHTRGPRTGRKLTPFVPTLNLRVGLENRRTAKGVPTLPTLPGGFREGGSKIDPPLCLTPMGVERDKRARVGEAGLERGAPAPLPRRAGLEREKGVVA